MYIYFSPHLDDVALSCGGLIMNKEDDKQTIFTIFAGEYNGRTKWDKLCKISSNNPVALRKKEDLRAAKIAGVNTVHTPFLDNAFYSDIKKEKRPPSDLLKIKKLIFSASLSAEKLFFPLGIEHPDHIMISKIGMELAKKREGVFFYEDIPYIFKHNIKKEFPFLVKRVVIDISKKIKMVSAYKSQVKAIPSIIGKNKDCSVEDIFCFLRYFEKENFENYFFIPFKNKE